jgi:5-oxoprolinase (ATP-hydrolysing)
MDDGSVINVKITVDNVKREAVVDFTGTSDVRPTNYNAPSSVAKAAVLLRVPHAGRRRDPDERRVPEADPHRDSAGLDAVAGVSGGRRRRQRRDLAAVTNCLYGALGVMAGAYGTMTELHVRQRRVSVLRDDLRRRRRRPDFDGASVVQCHMTNSRLTDPEVLEWRFPVRLDDTRSCRHGRRGKHHGGNGGERRVRFLER